MTKQKVANVVQICAENWTFRRYKYGGNEIAPDVVKCSFECGAPDSVEFQVRCVRMKVRLEISNMKLTFNIYI